MSIARVAGGDGSDFLCEIVSGEIKEILLPNRCMKAGIT
jgi:hypothetical protein